MRALNLTLMSILTLSLFASCEKKSTEIFAYVDIKVLNQQGNNMLSAPTVYNNDNIKVYYVTDGKAELYNQPNPGANKGFILIKGSDGSDAIRLFLNYDYKKHERTALTLVKFGNTKIDTIKADFRFVGSSVFCEQVWFNGSSQQRSFEIVKY